MLSKLGAIFFCSLVFMGCVKSENPIVKGNRDTDLRIHSAGANFKGIKVDCGADLQGDVLVRPLASGQSIVATSCYSTNDKSGFSFLAKMNRDGTFDQNYGVNGKIILEPSAQFKSCKIYSTDTNNPNLFNVACGVRAELYLMKLDSNGVLDERFGAKGFLKYETGAHHNNRESAVNLRQEGNSIYVIYSSYNNLSPFEPSADIFTADTGELIATKPLKNYYPTNLNITSDAKGLAANSYLVFWKNGGLRETIQTFNFGNSFEELLQKPMLNPMIDGSLQGTNSHYVFSDFVMYVVRNLDLTNSISFLKLVKGNAGLKFDNNFGSQSTTIKSFVNGISFDTFVPTVPNISSTAIIENQVKYKSIPLQNLPLASTTYCGWPYQVDRHLIFLCDNRGSQNEVQTYLMAVNENGEVDTQFFPQSRVDIPSEMLSDCNYANGNRPWIRDSWGRTLLLGCSSSSTQYATNYFNLDY